MNKKSAETGVKFAPKFDGQAAPLTRAFARLLQWGVVILLLAATGWTNNSEAANSLAGIWRLNGSDARLGSYTGLLELRERPNDGTLEAIRVVHLEHYSHQDGRGVDLVWTGTVADTAENGAQILVSLSRADFITQVGDVRRTAGDASPLKVFGKIQIGSNGLDIHYTAPEDATFSVTENALRIGPSGSEPIWQSQRFERETHPDLAPFTLDDTVKFVLSTLFPNSLLDIDALQADPRNYLFHYFADYHQLPAVQPYVNDPLFQRAMHLQIVDRTDFDYYQQNPNRLRVINKVVDPISLAETEIRANAFRTSLAAKESFYQEGLTREFVGPHGMVVRSIDALGQEQPDPDSALWTGVYTYTQALRYKISGEEEALTNLRRSLFGLLTLMDITGNSQTFARTLRLHAPVVEAPWHPGSGVFAQFDWLEGGNNDMAKGLVLGMIAGWEVLPQDDPLRQAISGHARGLLQLDVFQPNIADLRSNEALAYLLAGVTNDGVLADLFVGTAQTLLRTPALKLYAQSGGGPFYLYGISDWSGNHLTLTTTLAFQRLLSHTNATDLQALWSRAPAVAWEKPLRRLDHPLHAALAVASGTLDDDASKRKEAIDEVNWGLRSFPFPKHPYTVDHRIKGDFVLSPFPSLPWKQDWLTNAGRQQSIRAYPLFEQQVDEYRWNDGHFSTGGPGLGDQRVPGTDYLFLYWLSRNGDTECLLNWAENAYSNLFSPAVAISQFQAPFTYRYYRNTNSILGVSSVDNHVYYRGPDGKVQDVGPLSDWLPKSGCQAPPPPPTECLFNWAEINYPTLFVPAGSPTLVSSGYTYRYYSATQAYLGVSSVDNHVYYLGPDGNLQDVGPLSDWLSKAGCQ